MIRISGIAGVAAAEVRRASRRRAPVPRRSLNQSMIAAQPVWKQGVGGVFLRAAVAAAVEAIGVRVPAGA